MKRGAPSKPTSEFQSFADLAKKLIAVPKQEIAQKVAEFKRRRSHKPRSRRTA